MLSFPICGSVWCTTRKYLCWICFEFLRKYWHISHKCSHTHKKKSHSMYPISWSLFRRMLLITPFTYTQEHTHTHSLTYRFVPHLPEAFFFCFHLSWSECCVCVCVFVLTFLPTSLSVCFNLLNYSVSGFDWDFAIAIEFVRVCVCVCKFVAIVNAIKLLHTIHRVVA